jgi:hypothetical protein
VTAGDSSPPFGGRDARRAMPRAGRRGRALGSRSAVGRVPRNRRATLLMEQGRQPGRTNQVRAPGREESASGDLQRRQQNPRGQGRSLEFSRDLPFVAETPKPEQRCPSRSIERSTVLTPYARSEEVRSVALGSAHLVMFGASVRCEPPERRSAVPCGRARFRPFVPRTRCFRSSSRRLGVAVELIV